MKKFVITLIAAMMCCVLADMENQAGLLEMCSVSRESLQQYERCLIRGLPESIKEPIGAVLSCVGVQSFTDLADLVCDAYEAGKEEYYKVEDTLRQCQIVATLPNPTREQAEIYKKVTQECDHLLTRYST